MASVIEIGSLITRRPDVRGGRPCVAGTGVSVRRIALWHNMGLIPEEIVRKFGHLSLAQVHAALAYYHANHAEIDRDLEAKARETEFSVGEQLRRILRIRATMTASSMRNQVEFLSNWG